MAPQRLSADNFMLCCCLVDRLEVINPYFICCLKSNREKVRITTLYWCLIGYFVQCISQSPTPTPSPPNCSSKLPPPPKKNSSKLLSYTPLLYSFPNSSFKLLLQTPPPNSSLQSPPQNASLQTPPPNFSP